VQRAHFPLWQHPAYEPLEQGSLAPDRGRQVGRLGDCDRVTAVEVKWSDFDNAFWVLVEKEASVRGWIRITDLEFGIEPPQ